MKRTEASAVETKLVLIVPCVLPDVQHSSALALGSLSERGGYYMTMHWHNPSRNNKGLD